MFVSYWTLEPCWRVRGVKRFSPGHSRRSAPAQILAPFALGAGPPFTNAKQSLDLPQIRLKLKRSAKLSSSIDKIGTEENQNPEVGSAPTLFGSKRDDRLELRNSKFGPLLFQILLRHAGMQIKLFLRTG